VIAKESFVRVGETAIERYQLPTGEWFTEDFASRLQTIPSGPPDVAHVVRLLAENSSLGIEEAYSCLNRVEVREALRAAVASGKLSERQTETILGLLGGSGLEEVRRRLLEAYSTHKAHAPDSDRTRPSMLGLRICSMATSILLMRADDLDSARILQDEIASPNNANRLVAIGSAAIAYRSGLSSDAMLILEEALKTVLGDPDHQAFLRAALALALIAPEAALARVELLLFDDSQLVRYDALQVVLQWPQAWSVLSLVLRWLDDEPELRLRLHALQYAGPLLSQTRLARDVDQALAHQSPAIRYSATCALRHLPVRTAARLARRALRDEPDPGIKSMLEAVQNRC
jgi:hypothetical protein